MLANMFAQCWKKLWIRSVMSQGLSNRCGSLGGYLNRDPAPCSCQLSLLFSRLFDSDRVE